jgi:predicted Zn-dependent peptidase
VRLVPAVAACAAICVFATSGVPAATGELPNLGTNVSIGTLPHGGTYIVRPASGAPVAAVELWYRAPSTGFGQKPVPSLARLAAQVVVASKPLIGDPLGKQVSDVGGRLAITVYTDSISIAAVVPSQEARKITRSLTTAFFAPVVTDDGFRFAQRDVAQEALLQSFNPETIVRDAVFGSLFSSGPQHYPPIGTPKDVAAISLADVRAFATRAFRAQNAVLVMSGAVDPAIQTAASAGRTETGEAAAAEPPSDPQVAASPAPVSKTFEEPSGGYGWVGPPISNEREATAMDFIADYLFRPEAGTVTRSIEEAYPDALINGQFITLRDPGVMFVAFSGKNVSEIRRKIDEGFSAVRKPLDARTFAAALVAFEYHLLSDLQTPSEIADNFGWYAIEGNAAYAPGANDESGAYFKAASQLTPEFVAATAEKYLGKSPVSVTLETEAPK